ncbi:MAG: hypothetical protein KTR21_09920 [Rhodobacteraceae bacterium]|nr:hypothetical protein [Paracoccaceae bacterium]
MSSAPRKRALITAFEPFDKWEVNSSQAGVASLQRRRGEALDAEAHILPVDHARAVARLRLLLRVARPEILLLTGLANEDRVRLERLARAPADAPLRPGPEQRLGEWPWTPALTALATADIPARISDNAGLYVCETAYRTALDFRAQTGWPKRICFLHVPPLSEEWPVERIATAMEAVLTQGAAT